METDPFTANILGVESLVNSSTNKITGNDSEEEGITSDFIDELDLDMDDAELLKLKN